MTELVTPIQIASSGMRAQAQRLKHVSENIANVDTPGYRRKLISFDQAIQGGRMTGMVKTSDPFLDQKELPDIYDPAHPMANDRGFYQGSNVNIVTEIADAREASRSYEANLRTFEQARQMSSSLLDLIRR